MMYAATITFEQAKQKASNYAKYHIFDWAKLKNVSPPYLSDYYLEGEACWMFFRREDIIFPKEFSLIDCAYAVSKRGETRGIANYRYSPQEAEAYLKVMSDHFIEKGI